jgi:transposase
MAPYSVDLRKKILQAHQSGGRSQREIANIFHVSLSFVESLLRQVRTSGRIAPWPATGGPSSRIDDIARQHLRDWLAEQSDLTLEELVARLDHTLGIRVCISRMCRVLQELGLRRKKRRFMPRSGTAKK